MGFKKLDNRLKVLMENGITEGHRTMFVVVGPKARDQVRVVLIILIRIVFSNKAVVGCHSSSIAFKITSQG